MRHTHTVLSSVLCKLLVLITSTTRIRNLLTYPTFRPVKGNPCALAFLHTYLQKSQELQVSHLLLCITDVMLPLYTHRYNVTYVQPLHVY